MSKNIILEDLKKIEESSNKEVLIKTLKELKEKAKEIYILKLETQCWLDLLNLSLEDKKSIIDWINNLPDVKLTEEESLEIKNEIAKKFKRIKEDKNSQETTSWKLEDFLKKRKDINNPITNPYYPIIKPLNPKPYDITWERNNDLNSFSNPNNPPLILTNGWCIQ